VTQQLLDQSISPLQHLEAAVHRRAKAVALDLSGENGDRQLRRLIDDEIEAWQADHKRGRRPFAIVDASAMARRLHHNIARYGPLTDLLDDDDVWEIMINSPGDIFVKRHRGPSGYHQEVFTDDDHVVRTLTKILDESSTSHRKLDPTEGLQDAQLESGARLHIVHGDLARGGHLIVNIRKHTGVAFTDLDQLVKAGTLTGPAALFLRRAVSARATTIFAGAPGSGKTTLLGCCAAELDPALRVVIAEEVFETDVPLANVASLQTRPPRADRAAVDLRRLVAGFLRMAPDVAIVGEVRDREALPLLLTLSSGVTGMTTIHAGSARQALTRLRFICQLAETGSELPLSALNTLVSEAVDVVVHSERGPDGPRVMSVLAVEDLVAGVESTQFTVTEVFARRSVRDRLEWTGVVPSRLAAKFDRADMDLRVVLGALG
jgi:pilus assembly protein CpaF